MAASQPHWGPSAMVVTSKSDDQSVSRGVPSTRPVTIPFDHICLITITITSAQTTRDTVVLVAASEAEHSPCIYHLIAISRTPPNCVLAKLSARDNLELPKLALPVAPKCLDPTEIDRIATTIRDNIGLQVRVLRHLWNGIYNRFRESADVEEHRVLLIQVLDEQPTVNQEFGHFEWVPRNISFKREWERTSDDEEKFPVQVNIEHSFRVVNNEARILITMPWFQPGWILMMTSWVNAILLSRGMILEDRIREWNYGVDSLVMKCNVKSCEGGKQLKQRSEVLYVKAGVPILREAERTAAIARVVGGIVPEVLAVNDNMMIQRDGGAIGDETLESEALVETVLKMQRLSVNRVDELEAGGLRVMDAKWLACNVKLILNHPALDDFCGSEVDMTTRSIRENAVDDIRSRTRWMQGMLEEVATLDLPNTVKSTAILESKTLDVGIRMEEMTIVSLIDHLWDIRCTTLAIFYQTLSRSQACRSTLNRRLDRFRSNGCPL